jgi:exopolysaccharide biosynthesis polyprenyl glycosylphosphotransferase
MDKILHPTVRTSLPLPLEYSLGRPEGRIIHSIFLICDQILVFIAFALAYWMRYHVVWPPMFRTIFPPVEAANQVEFNAFVPVTFLLMFVLVALFETKGLYRLHRGTGLINHAGIIGSSMLTGIALLIVVVFLYRPFYYSRMIIPLAGGNAVVLLLLWRALLLTIRRWRWSRGIGLEHVLVVGGNGLSRQVMDGIAAQPQLGYRLVGYLNDNPQSNSSQTRYSHLGGVDQLGRVVTTSTIHRVILALPFWEHRRLPELVQACRNLNVEFHIAPDLYELSFDRVDIHQISGVPLIGLKELNLRGWNVVLKRGIDVALVVLTMPFVVPLALIIGLLIRLDTPGAALFRQVRVGKHGKQFTCYKFRTMVHDAEKRKAELVALNEADGPLFKMRHDPRITRIGRWLRRSSLDELPQLWNVLCGDMSLVGPRPALPDEVAQYSPTHRRRLEVTPGLTGLWQVLGRSDTSFDEMVRLDIYYAENWSVSMDLSILLRTIPVVLLGRGAY